MDQRGFFIGLISAYLQGALGRETMARLIAGAWGTDLAPEDEAALLAHCERLLRNPQKPAGIRFESEVRYCLECLRRDQTFEPERYTQGTKFPPVVVCVRVDRGVTARVYRIGRYVGVALTTRDPALLPELEKLQNAKHFEQMLRWCGALRSSVAGRPYYLLPAKRRSKFFRELKILLGLYFVGV